MRIDFASKILIFAITMSVGFNINFYFKNKTLTELLATQMQIPRKEVREITEDLINAKRQDEKANLPFLKDKNESEVKNGK